jgi:CheY-like chemotaxis protein
MTQTCELSKIDTKTRPRRGYSSTSEPQKAVTTKTRRAASVHSDRVPECPLSGVKWTWLSHLKKVRQRSQGAELTSCQRVGGRNAQFDSANAQDAALLSPPAPSAGPQFGCPVTNNVANPQTKSAVCDLRHIDWIILALPSPLTSGGRFVNLLIRRELRLGRFTMEFAQSGEAALRRINNAADVSIILILSDINMPGMTGLELLPKAKAARPDVPVIMITAYGDAETKRKALEGGAEALFTKPIDFGMLRGEIDARVERAA